MLKERNTVKELLQSDAYGTQAHVKGWVQTKREGKNVAFIALNDGSTIHHLQIVADVTQFGEENLKKITTGACIAVTGELVQSQGAGQQVELLKHEPQLAIANIG